MDKNHVTVGKSFNKVVIDTAMKITEDYVRKHSESMKASIINSTGQQIDFSSGVPSPELKIYVNAFASGVGNVLAAVLSGELDLYVIKTQINAGKIDEEPTP